MATLKFFHQSVVDVKKLIDILLKKLPVKNIYTCGISLGSIVSLITMANDNRISKGVFLLSGGNWEEIHRKGISKFIIKGNCISNYYSRRKEYREAYSHFPEFIREFKKLKNKKIKTDFYEVPDLKKVTARMCFLCDPLAFAHKINPEKVLMINAKFDLYFPKTSTIQLWKELGKPKIHWLNTLHTSNILTNKNVITEIQQFLLDI